MYFTKIFNHTVTWARTLLHQYTFKFIQMFNPPIPRDMNRFPINISELLLYQKYLCYSYLFTIFNSLICDNKPFCTSANISSHPVDFHFPLLYCINGAQFIKVFRTRTWTFLDNGSPPRFVRHTTRLNSYLDSQSRCSPVSVKCSYLLAIFCYEAEHINEQHIKVAT
jgi:hypothetical protein